MTTVLTACLAVAGLFLLQAWITIWSRRADRIRHVAMATAALSMPLIAWAGLESLGWNRPLWTMWSLPADVRILGAKMVQDEAIYLYLDVPGSEPRAVAVPWSNARAQKLQDLFDDPANGGQAMFHFEWSWDHHEPQFYPLPQPPIPMPKGVEPDAPHFEL